MSRYGINFYGPGTYYGEVPLIEFDARPVTAQSQDYGAMLVRWHSPAGDWDFLRVTRDSYGFAPRADMGTMVLEVPKASGTTELRETGLQPGKFYYYTVWVRATLDQQWRRAGDVIGLVTKDWGYRSYMYELIPMIYREKDMDTPQFRLYGKGQLERFMEIPGYEADHIRTEYETLKYVNDPQRCSGGLLPLMADQLGFGYENELGMRLARQQMKNAIYIYKHKGTQLGIEALTSVLTGWAPNVNQGYNLALDQNDSAFAESTGGWTSVSNTTISRRSITDTSGGYGAITGPVPPPVGASTGDNGSGDWNGLLTASGAGDMVVQSFASGTDAQNRQRGIPVKGGYPYNISIYTRALDTARSVRLGVQWFDANGTSLGAVAEDTAVSNSTGTWAGANSRAQFLTVAPVNARFLRVQLRVMSAASGEKHLISAFQVEVAPNLLSENNSSFETNITGWEGDNNATPSWDTTQAYVGTASLKMTSNAGGDMKVRLLTGAPTGATSGYQQTLVPVTVGVTYQATVMFRATSVARLCRVDIRWFTAAGAFISTSVGSAVTDSTSGWMVNSVTAAAPATAAYAAVVPVVLATGGAGEVHFIDFVTFSAEIAQGYQSARCVRIQFEAERINMVANASLEVDASGWTGKGTTVAQDATQFKMGTKSLKITPDGSSGLVGAETLAGTGRVTPGRTYTASAYFRPETNARDVRVSIIWYGPSGFISMSSGTPVAEVGADWVRASVTALAPPGATYGGVVGYVLPIGNATTVAMEIETQYIYFNGASGNYASVPDNAAYDLAGDLDLRIKCAPDAWVPGSQMGLIAKYNTGTNQRAYRIIIEADGKFVYQSSVDGTSGAGFVSVNTSGALPFVDGMPKWLRATHDVDNGAGGQRLELFSSDDGVNWTFLNGTTIAGTHTRFNSSEALTIGSIAGGASPFKGKIYHAEVRNNIAGTVVAAWSPLRTRTTAVRSPSTWGDDGSTPPTWTMNGSAWSYGVYPSAMITTPDSPALSITGDLDIIAKITPHESRQLTQTICSNRISNGGYTLRYGGGGINLTWHDGTTTRSVASLSIPELDNRATYWVRVTLDVDNGSGGHTATFQKSPNGVAWTTVNTTNAGAFTTAIGDTPDQMEVGCSHNGGQRFAGTIHLIEIRNGINGPVVGRFDPINVVRTAPMTPSSFTSYETPWTITGVGWDWVAGVERGRINSFRVPGTTGNYGSTPDTDGISLRGTASALACTNNSGWASSPANAAFALDDDAEIRWEGEFDSFLTPTTSGQQHVVSNYSHNVSGWKIYVSSPTSTDLRFQASISGAVGGTGSAVHSFNPGDRIRIKVTRVRSTGATALHAGLASVDWGSLPQLATGTVHAGQTIPAGSVDMKLGGGEGNRGFAGRTYMMQLIVGGVIRANPNFTETGDGWVIGDVSGAARTDSAGRTWTLNTNGEVVAVAERRSLRLIGGGTSVTTPDSAALSITGDIDLRIEVALDNWNTGAIQYLINKRVSLTGYALRINAAGNLEYIWGNGSADNFIAPAGGGTPWTPPANGVKKWLRLTHDVDNGSGQNVRTFYQSDDGYAWSVIGTANTGAGTTTIADGAAALYIGTSGSDGLTGNVFRMEVRAGINGNTVAAVDFTKSPWDVGDTNGATGNDPNGNTWTLNGSGAIIRRSYESDLDIRVLAAFDSWVTGSVQYFLSTRGGTGTGYAFRISGGGNAELVVGRNWGPDLFRSTNPASADLVNGKPKWLRVTLDANDGAGNSVRRWYYSNDGVTWTQFGSTDTLAGPLAIGDSTADLEIGAGFTGSVPTAGNILYVEVRHGIDGAVVAQFDAREITSLGSQSPSTVPGGAGETWTLTGPGWSWQPVETYVTDNHYLDGVLFEGGSTLLDYFDGTSYSNEGEYMWGSSPGNSPSYYYARRLIKNYRLNQRLKEFLPAGSSWALLYAEQT